MFLLTATGSAIKAAAVTRAVETLDISNLTAGIYTIQVVTVHGVVSQKLVVQ